MPPPCVRCVEVNGSPPARPKPPVFISTEHNHTFYGSHSPGAKYKVAKAMARTTFMHTSPSHSFGAGGRYDFTQGGEKKSPGPQYTLPDNTFGPQVSSRYKNAGAASFGRATREQAARASLSKEMSESPNFANKDSPGPMKYNLPVSLGRQTATRNGGMEPKPEWAWSSEERFKKHSGLASGTDSTPGPVTAKPHNALGPQRLGRFKSSPVISFGRGESRVSAFKAESSRSPGPQYPPYSSVGKQSFTGARTPPRFTFGTSTRDSYAQRMHGTVTPGPGAYNPI